MVAGCLYEAGFSTTGPHPQGGVAIARSIDDARQRLADMLIFCDPAAAATADITAFTPTRTVARYSGTVAELFADFNTGTPDRTVHARPLVGLTTPRTTGRAAVTVMCLTLGNAAAIGHHTDRHRHRCPRVHVHHPPRRAPHPRRPMATRSRTSRRGPSPTSTAGTASSR